MFICLYICIWLKQKNKIKEAKMPILKKQPQSSNFNIDKESLVQYLKSKNGSAPILDILLHFEVIQDPSDISSSKRAILRKARKGWTTKDESLKVNGKDYWTFVDGKVDITIDNHSYKSGLVVLLDIKGAKERGLI